MRLSLRARLYGFHLELIRHVVVVLASGLTYHEWDRGRFGVLPGAGTFFVLLSLFILFDHPHRHIYYIGAAAVGIFRHQV